MTTATPPGTPMPDIDPDASTVLTPTPLSSGAGDTVVHIEPPDDVEMWSYVQGDGKRFLQFSAFSRICLGGALIFLGLRGDWLTCCSCPSASASCSAV